VRHGDHSQRDRNGGHGRTAGASIEVNPDSQTIVVGDVPTMASWSHLGHQEYLLRGSLHSGGGQHAS
jgi:hypothetical protein